ncbi:unnamed protein product [Phytophthora fragariaefolia]|uniref:Unnamed protein product n=1 Tax=Phytophthora fragariaefolia TaxID=1490495 RepID=A0A9W6YN70_9STRA|nr:unnamed protein product [Phytophthora fragariaefolia]
MPFWLLNIAASMELFTRSPRLVQEVPVLEEKAVFPHGAKDFELIRQHDGAGPATGTKPDDQRAQRSGHAASNEDDEEKSEIPADIEAIIQRADDLFEQGQHAQTREYLKAELPKYPPSVEMVRMSCSRSDE